VDAGSSLVNTGSGEPIKSMKKAYKQHSIPRILTFLPTNQQTSWVVNSLPKGSGNEENAQHEGDRRGWMRYWMMKLMMLEDDKGRERNLKTFT
jgi:hypothetical protein